MAFTEIILSFLLYGILGWVLDSLERSRQNRRWSVGGFSFLPFAPIYGFGALIVLQLHPLIAGWPLIFQFIFFALLLGVFEYSSALYCEIILRRKLWDYSQNPLNLHGRTDLYHMIGWGLLSLIVIYWIHPLFFYH